MKQPLNLPMVKMKRKTGFRNLKLRYGVCKVMIGIVKDINSTNQTSRTRKLFSLFSEPISKISDL